MPERTIIEKRREQAFPVLTVAEVERLRRFGHTHQYGKGERAGNSAGQAAVYLATQARKVWMIVRGKSLDATMSHYLCERIAAQSNIEVLTQTEITALHGEGGALDKVH